METSAVAQAFRRFNYQKYSSFIALVVLFLVSAFLSPFFTRPGNLVNILSQVSYTGMISLGMAFVIITGGIDLSVGSLVAFDSLVGVMVMNYVLGSIHNELIAIVTGIVATLVLGAVTGLVNGITITRGRIAPFIVTLGTMAIFRSLALFTGNAGEIQSQSNIYGEFGLANVLWLPVPVWIMLFLALVLDIVLNRTRYGRYLCAVGSNTRVAVFSAINVDRVKVIAYTITGVLVAVACGGGTSTGGDGGPLTWPTSRSVNSTHGSQCWAWLSAAWLSAATTRTSFASGRIFSANSSGKKFAVP